MYKRQDLPNVALSYGRDALSHMQVGDVFDDPDIELVPVICADAACSGVMKKTCFDYIEQTILNLSLIHIYTGSRS